jgi:hypothetical protein
MSRLKANRAAAQLHTYLSLADDEAFCRMIWATREMQTRGGQAYARVLSAPPEARTTEFNRGQYVFPWLLETLVNERTRKDSNPRYGFAPTTRGNVGRFCFC